LQNLAIYGVPKKPLRVDHAGGRNWRSIVRREKVFRDKEVESPLDWSSAPRSRDGVFLRQELKTEPFADDVSVMHPRVTRSAGGARV